MSKDNNMCSGDMSMFILKLLERKDMYGYEMIETLRLRSNNVFQFKAGTLYPLLHTLVKNAFLTTYDNEMNGKIRKYYSITPQGIKLLKDKTNSWKEYVKITTEILEFAEV